MDNPADRVCVEPPLTHASVRVRCCERGRVGKLLCCCAVLVSAIGGFGYYLGAGRQLVTSLNGLKARAEDLDFGVAWANQQFPWKLSLTNHSLSPVRIASFVTTCSCLECRPGSVVIQPDETVQLKLTLDLSRAFGNARADAFEAVFQAELRPVIEGHAQDGTVAGWQIGGMVRRGLSFGESPLRIKDRLVRGSTFPIQSTDFAVHSSLREAHIGVRCPPEFGKATILGWPPSSGNFRLEVALNPKLEPGPVSFDVLLNIQAKHREKVVQALRVMGAVEEVVQLAPGRLVFGAEAVGARKSEYVTVVAAGRPQPFIVNRVTTHDKDVSCVARESALYQVSVVFSAPGPQERRIDFDVELPSEARNVRLPLAVVYHGR